MTLRLALPSGSLQESTFQLMRMAGFDIPGGPQVEVPSALPEGATGTGTKADPFIGATPEFLQSVPKPVFFLDEQGNRRKLE